MNVIRVHADGDAAWPDLADAPGVVHLANNSLIEIARLPRGMKSGKSSVTLRLDLPDGTVVLAETSMALFQAAAAALRAAEERDGLA